MRTLILCSLSLLLAGCVTAPDNPTPENDRVARFAGRAAYIGGTLYLKSHPADRGRFERAILALKALEATENPDASALAEALKSLPIAELKGDDGWLIVEGICTLWDLVLQDRIPIEQPALVKATLPQVRAGLERALSSVK